MKIVIFLLLLALTRISLQEEQYIRKEIDPVEDSKQQTEERIHKKRTLFGPGPYIYGRTRHVGIHPLGFKYVLGYGPIKYNYVLKPGVIKPVLKPVLRPVKPSVTLLKPVLQTEGWKPIIKVKPFHFKQIKPGHSHVHQHSHVHSNGVIHTHSHGHVHPPVVVQKPVVVADKPVVIAEKPVLGPVSVVQFTNPLIKPFIPSPVLVQQTPVIPQPLFPITHLHPVPAPPPVSVLPAGPHLNPLLLSHLHLLNSGEVPLPPVVPIRNGGLAVPLPIHFEQPALLPQPIWPPVLPEAPPPHLDLLPVNHLLPNPHIHQDHAHLHSADGFNVHDHHLHVDQHVHPEIPNVIHAEQHIHEDYTHHLHPAPQLPLYLPPHPNFKPLPPIIPGNSIQTELSATFPRYPLVRR